MRIGLICRCKDEFFIDEFVAHYLNQGVDEIHIIDDNSPDRSIYRHVARLPQVKIRFERDIVEDNFADEYYKGIRNQFDWLIYVDIDEFITTPLGSENTIREELETTFKDAHCIKVPWVMMSANGRKKSPERILKSNTMRWNHDLRHPNPDRGKFRCRYEKIEVKCIFKPAFFAGLFDHFPEEPLENIEIDVRDSIRNETSHRKTYHFNLREKDIRNGYLLCYHYRIISVENCRKKLAISDWYKNRGINLEKFLSNDYAEVKDETMKIKSQGLYSKTLFSIVRSKLNLGSRYRIKFPKP
jgi:hypothetical protein